MIISRAEIKTFDWSRSRDKEIYLFTLLVTTETLGRRRHMRQCNKTPLVTTTCTATYMHMLVPNFHFVAITTHQSTATSPHPLPKNIHRRCENKSYHLSVCLLSFRTTSIRFHISPPTYIQSAAKRTLRKYVALHSCTHTHILY